MSEYSKKLIFVSACMGMLIFGIVMAVLGAILPSVIEKFRIDLADAGSLFLIMNMGMLGGSVVFGPVVDRYGYKSLLIICATLVFAGMEGIAFSPSTGMLRVSLFLVGFAGGAINGGTNALVSDTSEENRGAKLSLLGVFFGIGALGVPFLLGTLLDRFSYESLIALVGALILLPLLLFAFIRFPAPKHDQGFPLADGLKLLRETTLLLFGLILFMQSGLEMTIGGWSAIFLNEELLIEPRRSVLFLSLYWLGLILARIALSEILRHVSRNIVMMISFLTAITGAVMVLFSQGPAVALPGLLLTGIGFAAIFPLVFSYVGDLYPRFSGTAFGVILAIALVGGMIFPFVVGVLAETLSLRLSLAIVPLTLVCSGLLFSHINKRITPRK